MRTPFCLHRTVNIIGVAFMASTFSYVTTETDSLQNCRYKHIMRTFLYVLQRHNRKLPYNCCGWELWLHVDILTSSTWQPVLMAYNELHSLIKLSVWVSPLSKAIVSLFTAILSNNGDVSCVVIPYLFLSWNDVL